MKKRVRKRPNTFQMNFVEAQQSNCGGLQVKRVKYHISSDDTAVQSQATQLPIPIEMHTPDDPGPSDNDQPDLDIEQSDHARRKLKAASAWADLRKRFVQIGISVSGFPANAIQCVFCDRNSASVLCKDCGTQAFLCMECADKLHKDINLLHRPSLWKEDMKLYTPLCRQQTLKRYCDCSSAYTRNITCVGLNGCYHSVCAHFCACEQEAETLLRSQLFPATPKHPQLAFDFALLDWFEALLLECQVSAQDFVAALNMLSSGQLMRIKKPSIYPVLIDSFEEYRHMKYDLRHLKALVPTRTDGSLCPACFERGNIFLSIDANFGLCQKKAAGSSVRLPLHHGSSLLFDQEDVDSFVMNYGGMKVDTDQECNQFLAGHALRSKTRFKSLDETALVAVACRHEHPRHVFSLRHGERLSYIVYALEKIKQSCDGRKAFILYDIACLLQKHLQKKGREDLLDFFTLGVPAFHCYGHKMKCQLKYSPRNVPGFGLSDGEVVERLWLYLRRFSRMSKEMRPSHRLDVICDALYHYCRKSHDHLGTYVIYLPGKLLKQRMDKAGAIQERSKKALEELMNASTVPFNTSDVQKWYHHEVHIYNSNQGNETEDSWEFAYFKSLQAYYKIQSEVQSCSDNDAVLLSSLLSKYNRLDVQLQKVETDEGFSRWLPSCDIYCDIKRLLTEKEKEKKKGEISKCARERWFLLSIKAKFADGQYLASRLSQSISKESAKLRDLITGYNNLVVENEKLMWADVSNLSSVLWESEVLSTLNSDIPAQVKLEAIKNHHLALRADEEISMLRQDMLATLQFYIRDWNLLTDKINELMDSRNANGEICSLQYARLETEFKIEKMVTLFSLYIDIPPIPTNDFLLHQINYVQQDSDHVEAVEILGSTVDCISNEGDTNEWEEESDIEDEIEVSSQAHSVERFLSESESIHNQCASIEVNMQSREDELVNIQSRKDEHKQSTEDEDSTSDYEMDESYFIALQNQLRREEYLKTISSPSEDNVDIATLIPNARNILNSIVDKQTPSGSCDPYVVQPPKAKRSRGEK